MIEKDEFGVYLVICDQDGCSNEEEYDTDDSWDELMRQMRLDGWVSKRLNMIWENYCPSCSKR